MRRFVIPLSNLLPFFSILQYSNYHLKPEADQRYDFFLLSAEPYEDHPFSAAGVILRVLTAKGFSVHIIEKPSLADLTAYSTGPTLGFLVTSGAVDSMINNYTPLKKIRKSAKTQWAFQMPDRAVILYCNWIRAAFKDAIIMIGGVEASLRRFAHYDYWSHAIRRSILLDSRADILVYGNGEKQIIEIAHRLQSSKNLTRIPGTCIISKKLPTQFELLPDESEVMHNKSAFNTMQTQLSNTQNIAQKTAHRYILQYAYPVYTAADLDWIYALPFSRNLRKNSALKLTQFSVVTHRGCFAQCHFCSIALHQGKQIISRSETSILTEIRSLTQHPDFKGYIDDLGGPSANMYGNANHSRLLALLKKARQIPKIKKIFVRSGIRYDLALKSKAYIQALSQFHISGCLKIAPEHFDTSVLSQMNKNNSRFLEFIQLFQTLNTNSKQSLRYYLIIGHPGETLQTIQSLIRFIKTHSIQNIETFQLFTPSPMSVSAAMYWTQKNPFTGQPIPVITDQQTKLKIHAQMLKTIQAIHKY